MPKKKPAVEKLDDDFILEEIDEQDFVLTNDNYFSQEASLRYMSVSQYKMFAGTAGRPACEAEALAVLDGKIKKEKTDSMLLGGLVDAYLEGTMDEFKEKNPELFTTRAYLDRPAGSLKKDIDDKFRRIVERIERDEFFMFTLSGQKQVIMTATMFGIEWKIKMDSYLPDKAIVDLKVMKSLREKFYVHDLGVLNFVENWGYETQLAVYQEVVRLNTGKRLPCFISAVSSEDVPDIDVFEINQEVLDAALMDVEANLPRVLAVKNREQAPRRCQRCDYCKETKVLKAPVLYTEILHTPMEQ